MHFHFLKPNICHIWLQYGLQTNLIESIYGHISVAGQRKKDFGWMESLKDLLSLLLLSVFFCKGGQISREALLGGIHLIVSEWSRWNVNVQHEKRREGETDEAWERICLCLFPFLPFFFHLSLSFRLLPFFCPPKTATAGATYWPLLHTIQKSSILTFQQRHFMFW